jgi:hypothetical protein
LLAFGLIGGGAFGGGYAGFSPALLRIAALSLLVGGRLRKNGVNFFLYALYSLFVKNLVNQVLFGL